MQISEQGIEFIKSKEGFSAIPYEDCGGVATIGYGTTYYFDGEHVTMDDADISETDATECLQYVCNHMAAHINDLVQININQYQIDALIDFCYNLGIQSLADSTLLKYINNSDFNNAATEFLKWDHAGGKVIQGLLNRRKAEKELFLNKIYS